MSSAQLMLRTKMLGALIREARTKAGKSMKAAAASIGITRGKLSSYEQGRKGISLPELELLAFELKVPLSRFLKPSPAPREEGRSFDPKVVISLRQRMIGATLRRQREQAEMSKRKLSEAAGFPVSRITAYERGDRPVPLPELQAILEALEQSIDDYVDTEGPVAEWNRTQQAFEAFQELPEELREFLSERGYMSYLRLAKRLSELPAARLRSMGEVLLEITG